MLRTAILTGAICAGMLAAQGPGNMGGGPPDAQQMITMRVNHLAQALGLSDAQKQQATTIFTNAQASASSIQTSLRSNQQQMMDAVKRNDTGAIDNLATASGTLMGQLIGIERKADAAFYQTLNPDQKTKFDSLHGFGGMMGQGMMGRQMRGRPQQ